MIDCLYDNFLQHECSFQKGGRCLLKDWKIFLLDFLTTL